MPCLDTAPPIFTEIRRLLSDSTWTRSTSGFTKTPPPITTRWPDRSVDTCPVSGLVTALPLRPVTMNASDGLAIL
nr:hypothetical protein [Quadrisphaera sp. INWT6]